MSLAPTAPIAQGLALEIIFPRYMSWSTAAFETRREGNQGGLCLILQLQLKYNSINLVDFAAGGTSCLECISGKRSWCKDPLWRDAVHGRHMPEFPARFCGMIGRRGLQYDGNVCMIECGTL